MTKITIIKKWYNQINEDDVLKNNLNKASVVYLDCDLYDSTRDALVFIKPLIQDGTIIVFDDFYRHKNLYKSGVSKAWYDFLSENSDLEANKVHNFRRVAFMVNKK